MLHHNSLQIHKQHTCDSKLLSILELEVDDVCVYIYLCMCIIYIYIYEFSNLVSQACQTTTDGPLDSLALLRPRLAILTILNATDGGMVLLAMKCSSFSGVNRGTSGRSPICGLGNCEYRSVREANLMMSRLLEVN